MTDKKRVKFYSRNDFSYLTMLNLSIRKLKEFNETKEDYSLDDIIEFYNIIKYIEDDAKSLINNVNDKLLLSERTKKMLIKRISLFFNALNNSNILILRIDSYGYAEDYLELCEKYKIYNKVSEDIFFCSMKNLNIPENYIYHHYKLVHHYDKSLRKRLLNDNNSFNLLLRKYFYTDQIAEIYLPESLSKKDKETIVINYINSEYAHTNYLAIIISLPISGDFSISDDTRILAKEKYDKLIDEFFNENKGVTITTNLHVVISNDVLDEFNINYDNDELTLSISAKWISENLDYPTLLNNFIYIFGLTDSQMRISNINKPNGMPTLTKKLSMGRNLKNFYTHSYEFDLFNKFIIMGITSYNEYLFSVHNIRLEEIIQWFFDKYLPEEFTLNDFSVNMPSKDSTYLEKCRTICCELESLLKQFDSLVKYGKIRHDIIEISSRPIEIEKVSSFIPNKYIYPQKEKTKTLMYYLFSDQAMLTYLKNDSEKQKYKNFYDLLINEKINIDDYEDFQKVELNYLFKENIIGVDNLKYIYFIDENKVSLLHDLFFNEFCVYNTYVKNGMQNCIDEFLEKGWITIGSSLFSIPESSYINFFLNKQKYFNGYDLRNTYLHGTQHKNGDDTALHKINYTTLLYLYILTVIKINDDLCQKDDLLNTNLNK